MPYPTQPRLGAALPPNAATLAPIDAISPSPLPSPIGKQTITIHSQGLQPGDNINFSPNDPTDPALTHPTTQGYGAPLYNFSADGTTAHADVNLNGNAILWQVQIISPSTNEQSPAFMLTSVDGVAASHALSLADAWTLIANFATIPGTDQGTGVNVTTRDAFPNGAADLNAALGALQTGQLDTYGPAHLYPTAAAVALAAVNSNPNISARNLLVNGNLWERVADADVVPYMSALNFYVGLFLNASGQGVTSNPGLLANAEWDQALARGAVHFDNGIGNVYTIPAEYVIEGPVHLPDGTSYLAYYDPRLAAYGETGVGSTSDVVVWNLVPAVPNTRSDTYDTLTGHYFVVPGTGTWYVNQAIGRGAGYENGTGIPASYAGSLTLMSPLAMASVIPGSDVAPHRPAPALPPPPPPPPPASSIVSQPGTGGVAPSPVIVTQDAAGNVISGEAIAPAPAPAVPAIVSTVPGANLVTVTTAPSVSPALIAVGVVAGLWFLSRGNR